MDHTLGEGRFVFYLPHSPLSSYIPYCVRYPGIATCLPTPDPIVMRIQIHGKLQWDVCSSVYANLLC